MKTIRWGIIGCGDVTEVKSGPGFQKATHSALVAVMRRNADLAADYARRHDVPKWYHDGQALIDDPEVDAVYIATTPDVHKHYTLLAAQAGKPVYVEKPMAMNHAECLEMIAACKKAGVPLWVAYYRRALPRFRKVRQLFDEGAIGDVRFVTVQLHQKVHPGHFEGANLPWRVRPEIAGGGVFVDLASHIFDYLDHLFGPIEAVSGYAVNQAGRYPAEDTVACSFRFGSGILGTGLWCFDSYTNGDLTEITGTAGRLAFSTFGTEAIRQISEAGVIEHAVETPAHVQQPLIQSIVDELNGVGHCPSTGESGARASWIMDQILHDYYAGK